MLMPISANTSLPQSLLRTIYERGKLKVRILAFLISRYDKSHFLVTLLRTTCSQHSMSGRSQD